VLEAINSVKLINSNYTQNQTIFIATSRERSNSLSLSLSLSLSWIPYKDILGNEVADKVTKEAFLGLKRILFNCLQAEEI